MKPLFISHGKFERSFEGKIFFPRHLKLFGKTGKFDKEWPTPCKTRGFPHISNTLMRLS